MKTPLITLTAVLWMNALGSIGGCAAHQGGAAVSTAVTMTNGEVRNLDKATRTITLRHDEIQQLNMRPMTMVFQAKEASMLDRIKVGDKVKFKAENIRGTYTVTEIEVAR